MRRRTVESKHCENFYSICWINLRSMIVITFVWLLNSTWLWSFFCAYHLVLTHALTCLGMERGQCPFTNPTLFGHRPFLRFHFWFFTAYPWLRLRFSYNLNRKTYYTDWYTAFENCCIRLYKYPCTRRFKIVLHKLAAIVRNLHKHKDTFHSKTNFKRF